MDFVTNVPFNHTHTHTDVWWSCHVKQMAWPSAAIRVQCLEQFTTAAQDYWLRRLSTYVSLVFLEAVTAVYQTFR